ncbi:sulfite oxidase [Halorussus halophilus]|uniref:sulfite oxidase n=1 Tax=Halorussus halophilus TaxID=2650975 RepID=UPI0013013727|nr:sulfite oxidase [Halorussus halophilus]
MSGENGENDAEHRTGRQRYLDRRRFLMATGTLAGVGVLSGNVGGQDGGTTTAGGETTTESGTTTQQPEEPSLQEQYPGLRILSADPQNAEAASRTTYESFITPREEHYIRNHYSTPDIDAEEWTVSLTGAFDEEVELTMDEIRNDFSTETVTHTMQCSGNGRSYFEPQVGGNQWTFGAVGNTVWTGTPLSDILEEYGADTSQNMWLSAMGGEAPEGEDIFTRSIPMSKVMDDCLLAYEMNGSPMNDDHGFPVRLLVPGWFGNNNVKWVQRLHLMDMMVYGPEWETEDQQTYTHWQQYSYRLIPIDEEVNTRPRIDVFDTQDQMDDPDIRYPYMYDQMVKSLVGYPPEDATVTPGPAGTIEVVGVAWAGDDEVASVEVSTDGGESWSEAEFFGPVVGATSWRQFRYVWEPEPGDYTVMSRATDDRGRTQPATISAPDEKLVRITDDKYPWNVDGYGATAYEPLGVAVTVSQGETETPGGETTTAGGTTGGQTTTTGGETTTVGGETTTGSETTTDNSSS